MTHEWKVNAGAKRPDPNAMNDFNVLTFNRKSFPGTEPLLVGKGERVRIRLGNLNPMDHHPIHIHGLSFNVTATDGGYIPESAQIPEVTVLVPVGSTRVIELVAEEAGDWAMHCHTTHHVMMQMGHGLPPMVGADMRRVDQRMQRVVPGYMSMGQTGMGGIGRDGDAGAPEQPADARRRQSVLVHRHGGHVHDPQGAGRRRPRGPARLDKHPAGTVASPADANRMRADGVDPASPVRRKPA